MKLLLIGAVFFLLAVLLFLSCKKDKEKESSDNQPPIANAGADIIITMPSCNSKGGAELDGSRSTDPNNNIIYYSWRKISGPQGEIIGSNRNISSPKARVENLSPGEYAFELYIYDAKNLFSKDTMLISVRGPAPKEYNLDVTLNGTYSFHNNVEDCYYYFPCLYYDAINIGGSGTFLPIGDMTFYASEQTDTAALRYATESHIHLQKLNDGEMHLNGTSTVNLKRLIQQGGGPFSGTLTVKGGSAGMCNAIVYQNLAPLTVTGTLDTTTKKTTITIKGKTYF